LWFNCFFQDNQNMKKLLLFLLATLAFNTAIAGVLSVLLAGGSFRHHFVFAQCIGLSIALVCRLIVTRIPAGSRRVAVLALSLPISVAGGVTLAYWTTGGGSWSDPQAWQSVVVGLFFGLIGAIAYLLAERVEAEVRQGQLIRSESENARSRRISNCCRRRSSRISCSTSWPTSAA
jgi:hypothetical protein